MNYLTLGQKHNITDKNLFDIAVQCGKAARAAKVSPIEVYMYENQGRVFLIGLRDGVMINGKPSRTVWEIKTREE